MRAISRPSLSQPSAHRDGRMIVVTLRGIAMLGVGIVLFSAAYIAGWPELLILASFALILPLLALAVVAARRPRLTVVRSAAQQIASVGKPTTATMFLKSATQIRSGSLRWSDELEWNPGRTQWQEVPAARVGMEFTVQHNFVPVRRGISEIGPLVAEATDPFGLARGEFALGDTNRIVVVPETTDLGQGLTNFAAESGLARLFQHRAIAGDHDIMTRDYRPGDPLGRVHWKATAHHAELMVREDEKQSHAEAVIVLDTRRRNWRDVQRHPSSDRAESESFEWALCMTSSLRNFLARNALRVRVVESAVSQLADAADATNFVESLARVQLSYQDGPALQIANRPTDTVGTLFAILDAPDEGTIETLTSTLLTGQLGGLSFAAAFTLGSPNPELDEQLTLAGWFVHRVGFGESVLAAWQALLAGDHDD